MTGEGTREHVGVVLGIGSNQGDREAALRAAVSALEKVAGTRITRISSLYETEPWGPRDQPPYLNMAVEISTALRPLELLEACLAIERSLGRVRRERWEPRNIDLDIILWGDLTTNGDTLTVPHPRFRERRFVLEPLAEMAPGARDPVSGRTAGELLAACEDDGRVARWSAW